MTKDVVFTKKAVATNSGYLVWLPKHIVDFLKIKNGSFVQANIKNLNSTQGQITTFKKVKQVGRGHHLWLSKDITEFLQINKQSLLEISVHKKEEDHA